MSPVQAAMQSLMWGLQESTNVRATGRQRKRFSSSVAVDFPFKSEKPELGSLMPGKPFNSKILLSASCLSSKERKKVGCNGGHSTEDAFAGLMEYVGVIQREGVCPAKATQEGLREQEAIKLQSTYIQGKDEANLWRANCCTDE